MIFYYKAVACKSGKTLVTGKYSDCVRFINQKANKRPGNAHTEPMKIMPINENLLGGLSEYERALKELFNRTNQEEVAEIYKLRSGRGRPKINWTESEDALLVNCKTYNDAAKVGKVLGKSTAAVWARVRRLREKKG